MSRVSVLFAAACLSAGCAVCNHHALDPAVCPDPPADVGGPERGRVHTYIVNGSDLLGLSTLSDLRDGLNRAGFTKVHVGQLYHAGGFGRELARVRRADSGARFVIVGYDLGAAAAEQLAADASAAGAAVDGVVLLDPMYATGRPGVVSGTNLLVVRSHQWTAGGLLDADVTNLTGVGHYSLPAHEQTVAAVAELLRSSATRVPVVESADPLLPIIDDPAPIPAVQVTPVSR